MTRKILVLSGTPASGKDTITAIMERCSRYQFFKKHKWVDDQASTDQRNATYHLTDHATFLQMAENQEFLQYHDRYAGGYGVSIKALEAHWSNGKIPIIHNGRQANLKSFMRYDLFSVLLLSSEPVTTSRIWDRGWDNKRMIAYHEERQELAKIMERGLFLQSHLALSTDYLCPEMSAKIILSATEAFWGLTDEHQNFSECLPK